MLLLVVPLARAARAVHSSWRGEVCVLRDSADARSIGDDRAVLRDPPNLPWIPSDGVLRRPTSASGATDSCWAIPRKARPHGQMVFSSLALRFGDRNRRVRHALPSMAGCRAMT